MLDVYGETVQLTFLLCLFSRKDSNVCHCMGLCAGLQCKLGKMIIKLKHNPAQFLSGNL